MNYWTILVLALAMTLGQSALAEFRTIELASEVTLSDFQPPASPNGVASFKTCESCEMQVVGVTQDTRYEFNHRPVSLQEFRLALSTIANRELADVVVMHHLESNVVTLISIVIEPV